MSEPKQIPARQYILDKITTWKTKAYDAQMIEEWARSKAEQDSANEQVAHWEKELEAFDAAYLKLCEAHSRLRSALKTLDEVTFALKHIMLPTATILAQASDFERASDNLKNAANSLRTVDEAQS